MFDGWIKRLKDLKFWGMLLGAAAVYFSPALAGESEILEAAVKFFGAALSLLNGMALPQSKSLWNPSPKE